MENYTSTIYCSWNDIVEIVKIPSFFSLLFMYTIILGIGSSLFNFLFDVFDTITYFISYKLGMKDFEHRYCDQCNGHLKKNYSNENP